MSQLKKRQHQNRSVARQITALIGLLVLCHLVGCAAISGTIPVLGPPVPLHAFRAGAAKVDITPIPGYPMGGHGPAGTWARGYWTRLFARAIYLEDRSGQPLVLVSCDLWSMPAGLADRIVQLASNWLLHSPIGRAHIVVAATHTHQSPGNFSSSKVYNSFASREMGFDDHLFEFLAHNIAEAIVQAVRSAEAATVDIAFSDVSGIMRNRSFEAFLLNREAQEILRENEHKALAPLPPSPEYPHEHAYLGVYPHLAVLRFKRAADPSHVIATAAFVALHPTSMRHTTEVYTSDLFGVAATKVEQALHRSGSPRSAVIAVFNGAEGDVSPAWTNQDRRDALRLGTLLAEQILNPGLPFQPIHDTRIDSRYAVLPLANNCFSEREPARSICTSDFPLPGVSLPGGAEDGRSVFYDLGFKEGMKGPRRMEKQGAKQPTLDPSFLDLPFSVTRLLLQRTAVPREVPLGVYRLGPLTVATLPGEFTTVMGRRIRKALAQALSTSFSSNPDDILLVGLANEYVSYFTTPEEYEAQHYEGASTLYGPAAGVLVQQHLVELARRPPEAKVPRQFAYSPGRVHHFALRNIGEPPFYPDDGLANILQDAVDGDPIRTFPRYCWHDVIPMLDAPYGNHVRVTPHVAIEEQTVLGEFQPLRIHGVEESDDGLNFVTVAIEASAAGSRWCVFWMPPDGLAKEKVFRFRVTTLSGTSRGDDAPFRLPQP